MAGQSKRLYRSQSNKVIAGVCGGIAEYLNADPTIIRIAWILLSLLPLVPGILIYIAAWIIIPKNPSRIVPVDSTTSSTSSSSSSSVSGAGAVGIFFIIVGGLFLMSNLHIFYWRDWWDISSDYIVPVFLIGAGLVFLMKGSVRQEPDDTPPEPPGFRRDENAGFAESPKPKEQGGRKTLRRSLKDRKLLGVCGGLAEYFEIDPSIVRVAFVVLSIWPFGLGVVVYGVLFLLVPEETSPQPQPQS